MKKKKRRLMRRKRRARVRFQERKSERLLQLKARKYHIHWYLPRRKKSDT